MEGEIRSNALESEPMIRMRQTQTRMATNNGTTLVSAFELYDGSTGGGVIADGDGNSPPGERSIKGGGDQPRTKEIPRFACGRLHVPFG